MDRLCDLFPWLCFADVEGMLIQAATGLIFLAGIPAAILWKGTKK